MRIKDSEQEASDLSKFYDHKYNKGYMGKDTYGTWTHNGAQLLRVKEILGKVGIEPETILDYGCGQGAWVDILATVFPKSQICGVDISGVAVEKARMQFPNVRFQCFDGYVCDFKEKEFDLIFSYHVLEHVICLKQSVYDICRMVKEGGYVCIIIPCGNHGSFEEKLMRLMEKSHVTSLIGETVYFYEKEVGHLRRIKSQEIIKMFSKYGLTLMSAQYSGQFIGWIDWLVRAHDHNTINGVLYGREGRNLSAKIKLRIIRNVILGMKWITRKKSIDLLKKRYLLKRLAAFVLSRVAAGIDKVIILCAIAEWRVLNKMPNGSEQFLVFRRNT